MGDISTFEVNGQEVTQLKVSSGEKASLVEIYHYGAHVTKWQETNQSPFLFVSKKAVLDGSKAIRGGIPIIFPQFGGLGPLKSHGFGRTSVWKLEKEATKRGSDSVEVVFTLDRDGISPDFQESFPKKFGCAYRVKLTGVHNSVLTCSLQVKNLEPTASICFTSALHTYFQISDISAVAVNGVKGVKYLDQLTEKVQEQETDGLTFTAELDRVYYDVPSTLEVYDSGFKRDTIIKVESGFPDAVIWNPWIEKAKKTGDLDDEEYHDFMCLESAVVQQPAEVKPNGTWMGTVHYQVKSRL